MILFLRGFTSVKTVEDADGNELERTSAQKFFGSAQANYKLENPDHRLFGFASYEDDRFNSFEYQATVAAGWSQKVWNDGDTSI